MDFTDGFLQCSCKTYERHGYPCHHILHVCNCNSIHQVQREWIDIRWTKDYLLKYLHPNTDKATNELYLKLKTNLPKGVSFHNPINMSYPIFRGFTDTAILQGLFDVPNFQFMSQTTQSLWIECNSTDDTEIQKLIHQNKSADFVGKRIFLSQEQQLVATEEQHNNDVESYNLNNDSDSDMNLNIPTESEVTDYTENFALFKRAFQLANKDISKHRELYTLLSNFNIENEINHVDNEIVMNERDVSEKIIISSNKVLNTSKRSMKRKKSGWE